MRSGRRVMSGSWEIMLSPMARQARPSGSAPRRMRRTLYCAPVSPAAFKSCSASCSRVSAVCNSATKMRFSREMAGPEDLERKFMSKYSRYNDDCQEGKPGPGRPRGVLVPQRAQGNLEHADARALRYDGFHGVGNIFRS